VKPRQRDEVLIAEVAAQVYRRRKELGLTLRGLSLRTGLTENYLGTVENKLRDLSLSSLAHLARGLGCVAHDLLGPLGLSLEQRKSVEDEVAMMLHAHRECLRNRHGVAYTSTVRFDLRDSYWGQAFGTLLGCMKFGAINIPGTADHVMAEIEARVLREENFGGSNECDHCLERYGKDGAGRKR